MITTSFFVSWTEIYENGCHGVWCIQGFYQDDIYGLIHISTVLVGNKNIHHEGQSRFICHQQIDKNAKAICFVDSFCCILSLYEGRKRKCYEADLGVVLDVQRIWCWWYASVRYSPLDAMPIIPIILQQILYIYIVAIGLLIKTVTRRVLGVKCIVSSEKTSLTLLKNTHKYLKKTIQEHTGKKRSYQQQWYWMCRKNGPYSPQSRVSPTCTLVLRNVKTSALYVS